MSSFAAMPLPAERTEAAPDGSDVRVLLRLAGGSMAHFALPANATSAAITHRTVEEMWFVLAGAGEMWRKHGAHEAVVALHPGLCLTIPLGTHFQFRAAEEGLAAVAVTMPPWPGDDEAVLVPGPWQASEKV